jgi:hypothetical protein
MPTDACDVHGDKARAQLVKQYDESKWPRAALAIDTKAVAPVTMKAPTLIAHNDPYNAIGSTSRPTPAPDAIAGLDPGKPIKRAIPVEPAQNGQPVEIRRAEPVRPMDQVTGEQLLPVPTPPSMDFSDGAGHP